MDRRVLIAAAAAGTSILGITLVLMMMMQIVSDSDNGQSLPESAHGPSQSLLSSIPPPSFSSEKERELVRIAKQVPGLKEWSSDEWQVMDIGYLGSTDPQMHWTRAIVNLELPVDANAPMFCEFGWAAAVTIDLDTMKVVGADYPTGNNAVCGTEFGQDAGGNR
jgi:hypothetical protein